MLKWNARHLLPAAENVEQNSVSSYSLQIPWQISMNTMHVTSGQNRIRSHCCWVWIFYVAMIENLNRKAGDLESVKEKVI